MVLPTFWNPRENGWSDRKIGFCIGSLAVRPFTAFQDIFQETVAKGSDKTTEPQINQKFLFLNIRIRNL